ncbi:CopM family metallochaperone [Psychrobacter namhaensis]|uniref:CopM family metallochaperone n=1 Tax=Psychrobacter namhaensis TaxID=292734 RepID=UPI0018DFDA19|nr:DUF305 domain-containing protein [Psychrobacter namhaensis]
MIASHRFALLATSISTALLLSACQPATEDNQPTPIEEVTPPVTDTSHAHHENMADGGVTENGSGADDTHMTDMLRDYTRSMTRMHEEMMIGMGYNDPDTAFAKGMLGHHRGAVDMAEIQLKYGTDAAMLKLAQDIVDAQQVEIDTLNKWLASHPDAVKPKPNTEAMQQAYAQSMETLHGDMVLGVADPVPDMAFARGMLPHHIGAVEMAKIQLKYGTDEEMRQLAQNIIDTQQAEIELMQHWIAALETDKDTAAAKVKSEEDNQQPVS